MSDRTRAHPADAWLECACGRRHWGRHGAAGLLLHRVGPSGPQVLLQHRALWSHEGGTWGIPGGALRPGEDPVAGALREAVEEAAVDPDGLTVHGTWVLDHGSWRYTTVLARTTGPQHPRAADDESLAVEWVDLAGVTERPLIPALAAAWPVLRPMVEQ